MNDPLCVCVFRHSSKNCNNNNIPYISRDVYITPFHHILLPIRIPYQGHPSTHMYFAAYASPYNIHITLLVKFVHTWREVIWSAKRRATQHTPKSAKDVLKVRLSFNICIFHRLWKALKSLIFYSILVCALLMLGQKLYHSTILEFLYYYTTAELTSSSFCSPLYLKGPLMFKGIAFQYA